ncbi:hypothetical protein [Hyalangium rubrum]|uniref:Uncharacterized protein n=1 Tax=Hyalangium rubrum TaxID=3103134 RepID=A0ABU5HG98_9BACT|nr:hypothetical protein [Hyalangium sp. s54d21]MDY7231884.1 hypothetical protein [Hyalangium sp. s54d21]
MRLPRVASQSALLVGLLLTGCLHAPRLAYSLDVPAQALTVAGAPPIQDGRVRFREIFCALLDRAPGTGVRPCAELLHRLSDEAPGVPSPQAMPAHAPSLALLFVPGLPGECVPGLSRPLEPAVEHMQRLGYEARLVPVSCLANSQTNAAQLARAIAATRAEDVILVGHSKGAVDILELLVTAPAEAARVRAVLSVAGAINGSPLAEAREGPAGLLPRKMASRCEAVERSALAELRRTARFRWLSSHSLPAQTHYFSLVAFTPPETISAPLRPSANALARFDPRNDGQLLFFDQVIPGSALLGYVRADHWSVATRPTEPGASRSTAWKHWRPFPQELLIEAAILHIIEALEHAGATR